MCALLLFKCFCRHLFYSFRFSLSFCDHKLPFQFRSDATIDACSRTPPHSTMAASAIAVGVAMAALHGKFDSLLRLPLDDNLKSVAQRLDETAVGTPFYIGTVIFSHAEYADRLRDATNTQRRAVHQAFLDKGLDVRASSPAHAAIVDQILRPVADDAGLDAALGDDGSDWRKVAVSPADEPELFEDFLDHGTVGLHVVNDQGTILWASKSEMDLLGYAPEEYIGQQVAKFHADKRKVTEILGILLSGNKVINYTAPLVCKDGHIEWVEINSSMRRVNGKCSTTRCFSTPITNKVKADEKAKFLRLLCHELRNPLQGIQGNLELMRSRLSALSSLLTRPSTTGQALVDLVTRHADDLSESAEAAALAAQHQGMVLNDTLTLSKLESGEQVAVFKPLDIAVVVRDVLAMTDVSARGKGLYLKVEVPDEDRYVKADVSWTKQVLINLLSNAIKFTSKGGITLTVEMAEQTGSSITMKITVADTGIGMDEEEVARLFHPFVQANASISSKYGGTGLGLHIVREYLARIGGSISVASEKGVGTTFTALCPCGVPTEEEKAQVAAKKKVKTRPRARSNVTLHNILIVEDNVINQKILRRFLERDGHQVRIANDGIEAIDLFCKFAFDLIFMDIEMPRMNGSVATGIIRRIEAKVSPDFKTPIVGLSGNALPEDFSHASAIGMNSYVTKPVALNVVVKTVADLARKDDHVFRRASRVEADARSIFEQLREPMANAESLCSVGHADSAKP